MAFELLGREVHDRVAHAEQRDRAEDQSHVRRARIGLVIVRLMVGGRVIVSHWQGLC